MSKPKRWISTVNSPKRSNEDEIAVYDSLLELYGDRSEAGIVQILAWALENKKD